MGWRIHAPTSLIAATATRLRPPAVRELGRVSHERWTALRQRLDGRRHARTLRTRFRRNPDAYLAALEQQACQPTLPAYSGVRLTRRIAGVFEEVPAGVGAEQGADVAEGGPERLERARG